MTYASVCSGVEAASIAWSTWSARGAAAEAAARSEQLADVVRMLKRIEEAAKAGNGPRRVGKCAT